MSDDDISLLTIVLRGQYFSNIHIVELVKNLLFALLYSLIVRTVFIMGCSSFGPNVPESIGRLLVISYALFIPIVFLTSPFEVLVKKEMIIKGDCYATNHARNIQKAITNMYKWNGAAVVDIQAYKMFFVKEPSLGERLLAIERCYAAKK